MEFDLSIGLRTTQTRSVNVFSVLLKNSNMLDELHTRTQLSVTEGSQRSEVTDGAYFLGVKTCWYLRKRRVHRGRRCASA